MDNYKKSLEQDKKGDLLRLNHFNNENVTIKSNNKYSLKYSKYNEKYFINLLKSQKCHVS